MSTTLLESSRINITQFCGPESLLESEPVRTKVAFYLQKGEEFTYSEVVDIRDALNEYFAFCVQTLTEEARQAMLQEVYLGW